MRSVGRECLSLAMILAIPIGIVLTFPMETLTFKASEPARLPAHLSFATLTPEVENRAFRAVRSVSWRSKIRTSRRQVVNLFCAELPEDPILSILSPRDRTRLPDLPVLTDSVRAPYLPSQKAPPPATLEPDRTEDPPVFSREELLKLN